MSLLLPLFSITIVQIPGLILRYLPFSNSLNNEKKKKLFLLYFVGFIFQTIVVLLYINGDLSKFTPLTYKRFLFILSTIYVFINTLVIGGSPYMHLFIYGMQGGYTILIHSLVAILIRYGNLNTSFYTQLLSQSAIYIALFTLFTIPLWKGIRDSIIFNSTIRNEYYWNVIWLIPALVIYSDVIVSMNSLWVSTPTQIFTRSMTALALIVSWRWIVLDFNSLENILQLKNLNKMLHIQSEGIIAQAGILKESENHIKICKHDMRHNLGIITSLIKSHQNEDALKYISELNKDLISEKQREYCKNPIINSAILVYQSKADKKNIPVTLEINIPKDIPWYSNDIAILIANVFENAINASIEQPENEREIFLSARFKDNKLAILIKNRFNKTIILDSHGFPTTTKENHGIGIQSVLSIVKKHRAFASCKQENGWITMSFLFS